MPRTSASDIAPSFVTAAEGHSAVCLYVDESLESRDHMLVAGVAIAPYPARRLVRRFRDAKKWRAAEVKGSSMDLGQQQFFLDKLAPLHLGAFGTLACAVHGTPTAVIRDHGEDMLYAALASKTIAQALHAGTPVMKVVADGGRYPHHVERRLLREIPALVQELTGGTCPAFSIDKSIRLEGLQVVDVVANHVIRRVRAASTQGFAHDPLRAFASTETRATAHGRLATVGHVTVTNGTYAHLPVAEWIKTHSAAPETIGVIPFHS